MYTYIHNVHTNLLLFGFSLPVPGGWDEEAIHSNDTSDQSCMPSVSLQRLYSQRECHSQTLVVNNTTVNGEPSWPITLPYLAHSQAPPSHSVVQEKHKSLVHHHVMLHKKKVALGSSSLLVTSVIKESLWAHCIYSTPTESHFTKLNAHQSYPQYNKLYVTLLL